ncbi:hypothetical protein FQA39_LY03173 [Lamprigera yunnana]|nr:hypothetical protein FQA39_LY03173 [Lamprigera yunnana]
MAAYCFICSSNNQNNPNLSFFRFPKDENRCVAWLQAALDFTGRPHLPKYTTHYCYNNLRVCSKHFEEQMFAGFSRSRLNLYAIPTVCFDAVQLVHLLSRLPVVPTQFHMESVVPRSPIAVQRYDTSLGMGRAEEQLSPTFEVPCEKQSAENSCQTPPSLSAHSPRKTGLRRQLHNLKRKCSRQVLHEHKQPPKQQLSVEDVSEFLEEHYSLNIANFIKTQMTALQAMLG